MALSPTVRAASIAKANNADNLDLTTSWNGAAVPSTNDVAVWNSTVTGDSTNALGSNLWFGGILVSDPAGPVTLIGANTLTLGSSGIDMSAAAQNLTIQSGLTLAGGISQTWRVATGRTLSINTGSFARISGASLLVDRSSNSGAIAWNAPLTNGLLPWGFVKSGGTAANNSTNGNTFASVAGGSIAPFTNAVPMTSLSVWGGIPAGGNGATNYDISSSGAATNQTGSGRNVNTLRYTGSGFTAAQANGTYGALMTANAILNAGTGPFIIGGGNKFSVGIGNAGYLVLAPMSANIVLSNHISGSGDIAVAGGGAGIVSFAGTTSYVGYNSGVATTMAIENGATLSASGDLRIGGSDTNTAGWTNSGALTVNGTAAASSLTVARASVASQNMSGSAVVNPGGVLTSTNTLLLGYAGSGTAALSVNGGTVNAAGGSLVLHQYDTTQARLNISSGSLKLLNNIAIIAFPSGGNGSGTAIISQTGGTVTFYSDAGATVGGTGYLEMQGYNAAANSMTYNLDGGTLTVPRVQSTQTSGTRAFNFNGGTLKAAVSTASFFNLNTGGVANVRNGGALIDDNGKQVTIGQALVHSTIGGDASTDGGVTKSGNGTLTLAGANTYNGATTVNAGTLSVSGSIASTATVNNGATLNLAASGTTSAGVAVNAGGSVNGSGAVGGTLTFNAGANALADVGGAFVTANGINFAGPASVSFVGGVPNNGQLYAIYGYGAGGVSNLSNLVAPYRLTVVDDTTNKLIFVSATTTNLVWSTGSGVWTNAGGTNWGGGAAFYAGDGVTFTNSPSSSVVTVSGSVLPGNIFFDASTAYVLAGAGSIGGGALLSKSGNGTLTIENANVYSGGTALSGGRLNINNASAIGSGVLTVTGGSVDNTSGLSITTTAGIAQVYAGDVAYGSGSIDFSGGWATVTGSGTRTIILGGGTITVGRLVSSNNAVTLSGAGTYALSANSGLNTNSASVVGGDLTVTNGALLQMNTAGGGDMLVLGGLLGNGTISNGGSARWLFLSNSGSSSFSGSLAGTAGLSVFAGAGTQTLSGSNSYTDTTTVASGGLVVAGTNSGGGAITVSGGNLGIVSSGSVIAGTVTVNSAAGILNVGTGGSLSSGAVNVSAGNMRVSNGANFNAGALTVSGGSLTQNGNGTANGAVVVSGTASTAVLNLGAGTVTVPNNGNFLVGNSTNSALALVNQSGGSILIAPTNNFVLGGGSNAYARYNMSGGVLTLSSATSDKVFRLGQSSGSNAVSIFDMTGGELVSGTGFSVNDANGGTGAGGYASMYVTGGLASNTSTGVALGIGARSGTADVTIGGSGVVSAGQTVLGYSVRTISAGDGTRTGILNLGTGSVGGTLQTGSVGMSAGGTNSAYLGFNGGTLKALADSATFLQGLTAATVYAAGGMIDNGGKSITVAQTLDAPAGGSVTNFSMLGGGYSYPPYVRISGGGGGGATAIAQIDGGGTLTNIVITSPGSGYTTAPTVTLIGGGGSAYVTAMIGAIPSGGMAFSGTGTTTLTAASTYTNTTAVNAGALMLSGSLLGDVTVGSGASFGGVYGTMAGRLTYGTNATVTADTSGGYVTATNGVVIAGPTQVLFNGMPLNGVPYILFGYGTGGVSGVGNLSSPYRLAISNDIGTQTIVATFASADLVWSTGNGVWTNAGGTNWSGSGPFYAGDTVTFTNSAGGATVTIQGQVLPTSILVDSSSDYSFSGSGGISGTTSLTKAGTGTLTLSTSNSYTGGTILNAGQLNIDHPYALGTSALTINGGAIDNTSGGPLALATSNAQYWDGDFAFLGTYDLSMAPGAVTAAGDRTVTLGGGKTLTVGKVTAAGGLRLAGAGTLAVLAPTGIPGGNSSVAGTLEVDSGATLNMNAGVALASTADWNVGGLSGGGTIFNGGGITRWLFVNSSNTTTFSGTLRDGTNGVLLGLTKSGNGTLVLSGTNSFTDQLNVNGGAMIASSNNDFGAGGLNIAAGATLLLSASNSGSGNITDYGALVLAHSNALGTVNRLLRFSGTNAVLDFQTDGDDTLEPVTMGSGGEATIVSGRATPGVGISHHLTTQSLANGIGGGTIHATAGTNVTGGMARVVFEHLGLGAGSPQTTLLDPTTAAMTVGSVRKENNNISQILGLGGTNTENYVTGTIENGPPLTGANSVALAKTNTGTWYLTGTNTYSGTTTVAGGSLFINGNNSAATNDVRVTGGVLGGAGSVGGSISIGGATLAPGASASSIGTLTALGVVLVDVSSTLSFEVAGNGNNDSLSASGGLGIFGTINVVFNPGYTPASGDTFDFIAGAISGTPTLSLPTLSNSLGWITNDFLSTGVLYITNTNSPGPANAYATWLTNYPGMGTNTNATDDPDGDGFNNANEFAFDGNPTAGTPALLKATRSGTNLVFAFVANNSIFPTNYAVLSAANLKVGPFATNAGVTASISNAADQSGVLLTNDYTRKEFRVPISTTNEYFRVQGTLP